MKKPQLFLLHFAGGNCYSFNFIASYLNDYFDVFSVELPGRGKRISEKLLNNFNLAAEDIFYQIRKNLTSEPILIYGHSMGSLLALKVTYLLEKVNTFPSYLIVSGNPGPGIIRGKNRYLMGHDDFHSELKKIGGIPQEVLENKELMTFFEPILRADFEITERNEIEVNCIVKAPIFAMMGDNETEVSKISNWSQFTTSDFDSEIMEGNHFFIYPNSKRIANTIKRCYYRISMS